MMLSSVAPVLAKMLATSTFTCANVMDEVTMLGCVSGGVEGGSGGVGKDGGGRGGSGGVGKDERGQGGSGGMEEGCGDGEGREDSESAPSDPIHLKTVMKQIICQAARGTLANVALSAAKIIRTTAARRMLCDLMQDVITDSGCSDPVVVHQAVRLARQILEPFVLQLEVVGLRAKPEEAGGLMLDELVRYRLSL